MFKKRQKGEFSAFLVLLKKSVGEVEGGRSPSPQGGLGEAEPPMLLCKISKKPLKPSGRFKRVEKGLSAFGFKKKAEGQEGGAIPLRGGVRGGHSFHVIV